MAAFGECRMGEPAGWREAGVPGMAAGVPGVAGAGLLEGTEGPRGDIGESPCSDMIHLICIKS